MKILILFTTVFFLVWTAAADDFIYGERGELSSLATAVRMAVGPNGEMPKKWDDFDGDINLSTMKKGYFEHRGQYLEDKYIFINRDFDIPGLGKATIVLLRTAPINIDQKADQRFLVYATNGKTSVTWKSYISFVRFS